VISADEVTDITDKLILTAQREANRDRWDGALAAADEALKNDPMRAAAMYLAGQALRKSGNEGTALALLTLASKIEPKRAAIWLAMAQCMQERHPLESYRAAQTALRLGGEALLPDTLSLLCNVSSVLGRHAEALEWAERFEAKYGVAGEVCHNKSFALFALGRWREGWREFKASLGMPNRRKRNYHADRETPRWNPDKHENAVVAIYGEQGIGDEIMYASMIDRAIEAAEAKGSRVVIECYDRNAGLFARSFGVSVYGTLREDYSEWPRLEGVTHRLEMGGLGEYFGQEPFRRREYLRPDFARRAAWQGYLDCQDGKGDPRIGLAWTGGSWETGRGRRSLAFDDVLQLIRGQDATFVCLEYEDRRKDLEFAPHILNPRAATQKGQDMDELAALLVNLDLVISVQTSVVDLCGALGVPCWALVDEVPQWRYVGDGAEKMSFYESVKVYRQKTWGDWAPVVNQVARDLKAFTDARKAVAAE
jgi:tetratricopeptide (TPR) repeat protein